MADETKIIYHIDDEETPYLVKISKGPSDVTLGDFKNILNRPSYKFFFKSMDDDFGVVKEEITDDESGLPCVNGRVVAWLVTSSEGSNSDVGRTFSESGSEPHDAQSVLSDPDSLGAPRSRAPGTGDSRPPSFHGRTGLPSEKEDDCDTESVVSRQSQRHRPKSNRPRYKPPPADDSCEESSIFSSDLDTTSVADSEDDRRSRMSLTDGSTSLYHGRQRRRRRRPRMPHVQRCTSFSTITESTMSLNIITVTLNMDKANFLGISIVGQSGSRGDGGIHVGSVMKGGAVALDGRIDPGDMLLQVNDVDFQNMSNDDAVRVLREMVHKPGPITLTVAKCWDPSPQGFFTLPQSEPVRPINTEAWVQQLAIMRGQAEYLSKDMVNQSLGTMTSTSSSLTSSLPESDRFPDENYCHLHVNSDMQVIVKALASADSGLDVRDRMWLKITIPNAFIGSDLVDWLFSRVQGFTDRREARKYASSLLKAGYIRHTVNKITFSEQCYYVFGDLCGKMASMSIKEGHEGSDQDTLAPLPQPNVSWGNAPPAYAGWRPPFPMGPQFGGAGDHHAFNPAMFQAPPSHTGSGSPRSLSSGSQKSREKEPDRESRSSGASSCSDRSGSSKGDRASIKERPQSKEPVVGIPPPPAMRDYGRLDTMPDTMAASRSSFQIALANPCELFVDVM